MTVHDRPDYDAEIAKLSNQRQQLQAQFDRVKHSYDTGRIIDAKVALANCDRRLCELRGKKAAAQSVEAPRSGAIFYGSNN